MARPEMPFPAGLCLEAFAIMCDAYLASDVRCYAAGAASRRDGSDPA
jgi:hypothetical protein